MRYRSTKDVVDDLRANDRLIDVEEPFSAHLEIPEIQRRVYASGGPAVYFHRPLDSHFPMVGNLFGSLDQARFLFRGTLERVRRAIELKIDPSRFIRSPLRYLSAPRVGWSMMPKRVSRAAVLANSISLEQLPRLQSWPMDGGPFITLPQVLSQSVSSNGLKGLNLGMYRIQLAGNDYLTNQEVGLHYQIHRGIGVHHQEAIEKGRPLQVNIFVGGHPSMTLAAVMPLPEGMSELTFAGALAGYRIPMYLSPDQAPIYSDADFCIVGEIDPSQLKPEGPFGDHLGYYSLVHDFPLLKVKSVFHRKDAIWPFTVVGRPPQEDTTFGELIHELTGPVIPTVVPGVKGVHAVDAAGVHPLLLAIGSERYTPYRKPNRPQELLTQANALLGQGQLSLAKYLFILDEAAAPDLKVDDISNFFRHFWERVDLENGLHFQTRTTIDTLDYSGEGLNFGSKLVLAASGPIRRKLATTVPTLPALPSLFGKIALCMPGVLAVEAPKRGEGNETQNEVARLFEEDRSKLADCWRELSNELGLILIVLVDDAAFASKSLNNWLWVTFTRSNPAVDVGGIREFVKDKHWGCCGPLIIDARCKPHHAPPLIESSEVTAKIDAYASRGGALAKYL